MIKIYGLRIKDCEPILFSKLSSAQAWTVSSYVVHMQCAVPSGGYTCFTEVALIVHRCVSAEMPWVVLHRGSPSGTSTACFRGSQ